jgi:hypothetical protein
MSARPITSMRMSQRFGIWPTNIMANTTGTQTMQDPRSALDQNHKPGCSDDCPQQMMRKKAGIALELERNKPRVRIPAMIANCEG